MQQQIVHLALTGGPGGGKTTTLSHLVEHLRTHSWRVLVVPEAATLFIAGGVHDLGVLAAADRPKYLAVQKNLMALQLKLKEQYHDLALSLDAPKTVVIHDRGICDSAAYTTKEEYASLLKSFGLTPTSAYSLYDAVLHLRSAATTNSSYEGYAYTAANNSARLETASAAALLDESTLLSWQSHPHLMVIGACDSFDQKVNRALQAVLGMLGDPEPLEIERKFRLVSPVDLNDPIFKNRSELNIKQVYLPLTSSGEQRVRASTLMGITMYTHATKREVSPGVRIEVETSIDEQTWRMLKDLKDPATSMVEKVRHVFMYEDTRFELDHILSPVDVWLLEVETISKDDVVILPPCFKDAVEVTNEPAWRNRKIAESKK